jgi:hypothetical protein
MHDPEHQWAFGRHPFDQASDSLEEPSTLQGRVSQWRGRRECQIAEQPTEVRQPTHQLPHPACRQGGEERIDRLQDRGVGEIGVQCVRRPAERQEPTLACQSQRLCR